MNMYTVNDRAQMVWLWFDKIDGRSIYTQISIGEAIYDAYKFLKQEITLFIFFT